MKKWLLVGSVVLNCVLLFVVIKYGIILRQDFAQRYVRHNGDANVTFIGDSQTAQAEMNFLLNRFDLHVYAYPGFNSEQLRQMMPGVFEFQHPKRCIVLADTNDLGSTCFSVSNTLLNYKGIADSIRAHQSIPTFVTLPSRGILPRVDSVNKALKDFCALNKIDLIDLQAALNHNASNFIWDGKHISQQGYQEYKKLLISFLAKHDL